MKHDLKNRLFLLSFLMIASVYLISCNSIGSSNGSQNQTTTESENQPALIFHEDFENYNSDNWYQTDSSAWKIEKEGDNSFIALVKQSEYAPPHRSPLNINLIKNPLFNDFTLTLKAKSTKGDYNHRDLCVFFGYQDASHFYYAHLGMKADAHAHSIFIVNDTARVSIATERTDSLTWGGKWHDVKVNRDTESGSIEVYFDNMKKPIMKAVDKTFPEGKIGIGSFDDTGYFDEIKVFKTKK